MKLKELRKVATDDAIRVGLGLSATAKEYEMKKKLQSLTKADEKKVKQYYGLLESVSESKEDEY